MDIGIRVYSPNFGANIAKHFVDTAHNYYNYAVVTNRMKHVYKFNTKVDDFGKYGFDNYTLDYARKTIDGHNRHYLIASDEKTNKNIVVLERKTLAKIVEGFLNLSKNKFQYIMKKNRSL